MKVKDLLNLITDNYVEVAINVYKGQEHTGRRYIIEKHAKKLNEIPEDILQSEVDGIVLYYDRISIEIDINK